MARGIAKTCFYYFMRVLTSPFGLAVINTVYLLVGAWIFFLIESPNEVSTIKNLKQDRDNLLTNLVNAWAAIQNSAQAKTVFEKKTGELLAGYETSLATFYRKRAVEKSQTQGKNTPKKLWSVMGSVIYAYSVVTTIGWGNIVPTTLFGRMATIFYGFVGIPLVFTLSSEVGNFTNKTIRFFTYIICGCSCRRKNYDKSLNRYAYKSSSSSVKMAIHQAVDATAKDPDTSHYPPPNRDYQEAHNANLKKGHARTPIYGSSQGDRGGGGDYNLNRNTVYLKSVASTLDVLLEVSQDQSTCQEHEGGPRREHSLEEDVGERKAGAAEQRESPLKNKPWAPRGRSRLGDKPYYRLRTMEDAIKFSEELDRLSLEELCRVMKFVGFDFEKEILLAQDGEVEFREEVFRNENEDDGMREKLTRRDRKRKREFRNRSDGEGHKRLGKTLEKTEDATEERQLEKLIVGKRKRKSENRVESFHSRQHLNDELKRSAGEALPICQTANQREGNEVARCGEHHETKGCDTTEYHFENTDCVFGNPSSTFLGGGESDYERRQLLEFGKGDNTKPGSDDKTHAGRKATIRIEQSSWEMLGGGDDKKQRQDVDEAASSKNDDSVTDLECDTIPVSHRNTHLTPGARVQTYAPNVSISAESNSPGANPSYEPKSTARKSNDSPAAVADAHCKDYFILSNATDHSSASVFTEDRAVPSTPNHILTEETTTPNSAPKEPLPYADHYVTESSSSVSFHEVSKSDNQSALEFVILGPQTNAEDNTRSLSDVRINTGANTCEHVMRYEQIRYKVSKLREAPIESHLACGEVTFTSFIAKCATHQEQNNESKGDPTDPSNAREHLSKPSKTRQNVPNVLADAREILKNSENFIQQQRFKKRKEPDQVWPKPMNDRHDTIPKNSPGQLTEEKGFTQSDKCHTMVDTSIVKSAASQSHPEVSEPHSHISLSKPVCHRKQPNTCALRPPKHTYFPTNLEKAENQQLLPSNTAQFMESKILNSTVIQTDRNVYRECEAGCISQISTLTGLSVSSSKDLSSVQTYKTNARRRGNLNAPASVPVGSLEHVIPEPSIIQTQHQSPKGDDVKLQLKTSRSREHRLTRNHRRNACLLSQGNQTGRRSSTDGTIDHFISVTDAIECRNKLAVQEASQDLDTKDSDAVGGVDTGKDVHSFCFGLVGSQASTVHANQTSVLPEHGRISDPSFHKSNLNVISVKEQYRSSLDTRRARCREWVEHNWFSYSRNKPHRSNWRHEVRNSECHTKTKDKEIDMDLSKLEEPKIDFVQHIRDSSKGQNELEEVKETNDCFDKKHSTKSEEEYPIADFKQKKFNKRRYLYTQQWMEKHKFYFNKQGLRDRTECQRQLIHVSQHHTQLGKNKTLQENPLSHVSQEHLAHNTPCCSSRRMLAVADSLDRGQNAVSRGNETRHDLNMSNRRKGRQDKGDYAVGKSRSSTEFSSTSKGSKKRDPKELWGGLFGFKQKTRQIDRWAEFRPPDNRTLKEDLTILKRQLGKAVASSEPDEEEELEVPLIFIYVGMCAFMVFGAVMNLRVNKEVNDMFESIYFVYVLCSTSGFGDILPDEASYLFHLFYGLTGVSMFNITVNATLQYMLATLDYLKIIVKK